MYQKVMRFVARCEKVILAITLALTLAFTFANVIGRFVFNHSLIFVDELVVALFVLISLMGAALCARDKDGLIGLAIISEKLSKKGKVIQRVATNIISILYCCILTWQGFLRTSSNFTAKEHTFVMHWPRWIFWSFIPLCGIFLILHFIENTVECIKAKDEEEDK